MLRDLFGGHFVTDGGQNKYWRPDGIPPSLLSSGCYLARWRFHNALMPAQIYLKARQLEWASAANKPSGFGFIDEINPRLLSNNIVVPYIVGVWEDYFRTTFSVLLKYSDNRDAVLRKCRPTHAQIGKILYSKSPEYVISECFSFQRPSVISENFKLIGVRLDLASAMRKPLRRRKATLYDIIERAIEQRNGLVHSGSMDLALFDEKLNSLISDFVFAVDRAYHAIGAHFRFDPIRDYF